MLTLRELLERIRPVGTPGASAAGELRRRHDDEAAEIAAVTALLAGFEARADAVVADAGAEARHIEGRAWQEARRLAATLPDRVAAAGTEAAETDAGRTAAELAVIRSAADREVARLGDGAATIPALVDATLQVIWASAGLGAEARAAERRP